MTSVHAATPAMLMKGSVGEPGAADPVVELDTLPGGNPKPCEPLHGSNGIVHE